MREVMTGLTVICAVLAICMGAGAADMRGEALFLAFSAGVCAAIRESFKT